MTRASQARLDRRTTGVNGRRLSSVAALRVREQIIRGEVSAGDRLRVEHLAEDFGMSATPVREALLELAGEGLATRREGGGFAVAPITRQDVLDLFDTQAYLSGELIARATATLTDEELDVLDQWQTDLLVADSEGRHDDVQQMGYEMHRLINRSARSHRLSWMLAQSLRCVPFTVYSEIPGWHAASCDDHGAILRALRNRNERTARDAMQAHIRNCGDYLIRWLEQRDVLDRQGDL